MSYALLQSNQHSSSCTLRRLVLPCDPTLRITVLIRTSLNVAIGDMHDEVRVITSVYPTIRERDGPLKIFQESLSPTAGRNVSKQFKHVKRGVHLIYPTLHSQTKKNNQPIISCFNKYSTYKIQKRHA